MGSSNRKSKQKKKDFRKQKLKVGKPQPKASSHTDTSFTVKAINVPLQSVVKAKTLESDIIKNISLAKHNTPQVRKEAVIFLRKNFKQHPSFIKLIISSVSKLIIDGFSQVRNETLEIFKEFKPINVQLNFNIIILYIQSAMTHITNSIRNDSTKFLKILMDDCHCEDLLVNNNWIKLIKCFFSLLQWPLNKDNIGLNVTIFNNQTNSSNNTRLAKIRHIEVFGKLLNYGALSNKQLDNNKENKEVNSKYLEPNIPGAFNNLQLFKRSLKTNIDDLNNVSCEDLLIRRKILVEVFSESILKELKSLIKEGGDLGRSSKSLEIIVTNIINEEKEYNEKIGFFQ